MIRTDLAIEPGISSCIHVLFPCLDFAHLSVFTEPEEAEVRPVVIGLVMEVGGHSCVVVALDLGAPASTLEDIVLVEAERRMHHSPHPLREEMPPTSKLDSFRTPHSTELPD